VVESSREEALADGNHQLSADMPGFDAPDCIGHFDQPVTVLDDGPHLSCFHQILQNQQVGLVGPGQQISQLSAADRKQGPRISASLSWRFDPPLITYRPLGVSVPL